jgi:hypothetical protein
LHLGGAVVTEDLLIHFDSLANELSIIEEIQERAYYDTIRIGGMVQAAEETITVRTNIQHNIQQLRKWTEELLHIRNEIVNYSQEWS